MENLDNVIKEIVLYGAIGNQIIKDIDDLEKVKKAKEILEKEQIISKELEKRLIEDFGKYKEITNETTEEFKIIVELIQDLKSYWKTVDNINTLFYNAMQEIQEYNFVEGFKMNKKIRENL